MKTKFIKCNQYINYEKTLILHKIYFKYKFISIFIISKLIKYYNSIIVNYKVFM